MSEEMGQEGQTPIEEETTDPAAQAEPQEAPTPEEIAEFGELAMAGGETDPASLSMLFDLAMPVAVELGRTRLSVQDILSLGRGSVVQLDRLAGEPIDVFVGDRRFAEGEVVVVGEQFGIRITRIVGSAPTAEAVA